MKLLVIDIQKGMTTLSSMPRDKIRDILLANTVDGILNVPKEYGMFISE